MFERLTERAISAARAHAEARADSLHERMRNELPAGIGAERVAEGVRVSGRGLQRRLALEPGLRRLIGRFG
jgi:hypothetical protein